MRMSNEHARLEILYLQDIRTHFMIWRRSDCTDYAAFSASMKSLAFYFERFPERALDIQRLVLSYLIATQLKAQPNDMGRLAGFGLEIGLMSINDLHIRPAVNALLSVSLAQSHLLARRRFKGLDTLIRADREAAYLPQNSNLEAFIRANREFIRGNLYELGLENEKAAERYKDAFTEVKRYLSDEMVFQGLVEEWSKTLSGEKTVSLEFIEQSRSLAKTMIHNLYRMSLLALARVTADMEALRIYTRDIIYASLEAAMGHWSSLASNIYDVNATEVVQVLGQLKSHMTAESMHLLIDIDMEKAIENAHYPVAVSAGWNALLSSTVAGFYDDEGQSREGELLHRKAIQQSANCDSNLIRTIVAGNHLLHFGKTFQQPPDEVIMRFLGALDDLAQTGGNELPPLRVKALLDESTSAAIGLTCRKWKDDPNSMNRVQLAALLDALRQPGWIKSPLVKRSDKPDGFESPASQGLWYAADRIERLSIALKKHSQTAVILIQYVGSGTQFICLTAEHDRPVISETASSIYQKASRGLSATAVEEVYTPFFGIEHAARKAYNALPQEVREIIEQHNILLFIPDFRTDEDSIPFELFHDGSQFLGMNKIIARCPSLAVATRILENESARKTGQRALVFEAANVEGYAPLKFAKDEVEAIQGYLRKREWGLVFPAEGRLTKERLLDHLGTSDLLHIAAHGDILAGDAALILPKYQRLVADDILRRRFPKIPFTYLNTCLLGESRYLGGGVSKGLAYSLLQSGAPAVIANLTPVDDRSSLMFSLAFYRHAAKYPAGEALRKARKDLAQEGIAAPFLGMTVLMGDPNCQLLDGNRPKEIDPQNEKEILIVVTKSANDPKKLTAKLQGIRQSRRSSPYNPRVQAALKLMESHAAVDHLIEEDRRAELEIAAVLAEEIGYLPALATTQISITEQVLQSGDQDEQASALDKTISLLEQYVSQYEPLWEQPKDDDLRVKEMEYRLTRQKLSFERQGLAYRYSGEQDADGMALLEDIHNLYLLQEMEAQRREGKVTLIGMEETLSDIAWNAIAFDQPTRHSSVPADQESTDASAHKPGNGPSNLQSLTIVHPTRFSGDMRATAALAEIIACKLINRGYLPNQSRPHAGKILSSVLLYLWTEQANTYRNRELMEGWTEGLVIAIEDIATQWSPPDQRPWFSLVRGFPDRVEEMLTNMSNTPYSEDGYQQQLDEVAALIQETIELIQRLEHEYPQSGTGCGAYILGTLLTKNIFYGNYLDKHLRKIYAEVKRHVGFGPYIKAGFERSREQKLKQETHRFRTGPEL